jgi:predicted  nucleic acid-binding Zn-ribbon protein
LEKQILLLRDLQDTELRIHQLKGDQNRYPLMIKELDEKLASEKETALQEKERLENLEKERRRKEGELSEEGERIKRTKGRLFEVKTNKEYQALLHEIELMENSSSQKEDEILAILEETDQLTVSVREREGTLAATEKKIRGEISEIEEKLAHLVEEIADMEKRRKSAIKALDGSLVSAYETLKARRGKALAAVRGGACQGCYVNIPPQMFNEVQRNETLIRCPNCNRFLYWSDENPSSIKKS